MHKSHDEILMSIWHYIKCYDVDFNECKYLLLLDLKCLGNAKEIDIIQQQPED